VNLKLWFAYTLLTIGLSFSPGPAVLTVVSQAIRHGWRRSCFGALGILSGNGIYFLLSALGIGAFIAASPKLYGFLRWGGIAYLVFSGLRALFSKPDPEREIVAAENRPFALWKQAIATQLANPKTIVFFASMLAPFIDPKAAWPVWAQIAIYAATDMFFEYPILIFYGLAADHGARRLGGAVHGRWRDRLAALCLLAVAAWLALRKG
jgi:homoserine/homoserine lactone efflux protein